MRQVLCPTLVSRDDEVTQLTAALAAARAGRGGTVLVTGEAGIGKSRLVRETTRLASEQGAAVLAGRAVALGVPAPFRPFAEALAAAGRAGRLPEPGAGEGQPPAVRSRRPLQPQRCLAADRGHHAAHGRLLPPPRRRRGTGVPVQ